MIVNTKLQIEHKPNKTKMITHWTPFNFPYLWESLFIKHVVDWNGIKVFRCERMATKPNNAQTRELCLNNRKKDRIYVKLATSTEQIQRIKVVNIPSQELKFKITKPFPPVYAARADKSKMKWHRKLKVCKLSDARGQQVKTPDKRTKLAKRQLHELQIMWD